MPGISRWCGVVCVLPAFAAAAECPQDAVEAHVREQFAYYGPLSKDREYFGFIFVFEGEVRSAVVRGHNCANSLSCSVDTAKAAPLIPKGAKVLGEWHTHPESSKAGSLSEDDVRGARNNRHIRCYSAYYSQPDGDVYAWNPFQTSVPTAMSSVVWIDNYRRVVVDRTHLYAHALRPGAGEADETTTRQSVDILEGEQEEHERDPAVRSP